MAVLQLHLSLPTLASPELRQQASSLDDTRRPFFTHSEAITELNGIFLEAAAGPDPFVAASPSVLAWALILHTLWGAGVEDKEDRELQLLQNPVEDFDASSENSPLSHKSSFPPSVPRSTSLVPSEPGLYETVVEMIKPSMDEDVVRYLAGRAVDDCHVFEAISVLCDKMGNFSDPYDNDKTNTWIRIMFLGLLRSALDDLDYIPELVSALLSLLTPPRTSQVYKWKEIEKAIDDPRHYFISDAHLMAKVFEVSKSRFPYETLPYLKICRVLAASDVMDQHELPFVALAMRSMTCYTQKLPQDFNGYHTIREDENANYISLIQPLEMYSFEDHSQTVLYPRGHGKALAAVGPYTLPVGTLGSVVSESRPPVVMWYHSYSCLGYLGRWLELFLSDQVASTSDSPEEIALEIIGLIASLLESSLRASAERRSGIDSAEEARRILEMTSDDIDRNGDIISVVFGIFERELQTVSNPALGDRPLDLVLACLQFLQAAVKILPGRVWPFMARSSLLGLEGRGGTLAAILSSVEVPSGNYDFLVNSIQLFAALVNDAVSNAIARKCVVDNRTRKPNPNLAYSGIPSHVLTKVLHAFGQVLVEVYESSANWRFNDDLQRLEMNALLADIFDKIIYYGYGINNSNDLKDKATSVLSTLAPYLLDFFLANSSRDITFNPLLRVIFDGVATPQSTIYLKSRQFWVSQVQATLRLTDTLIRAGRLLGYSSSLETQLFKASPVLVRLYASEEEYKLPVVTVLESLIKDAGTEVDPPSLLGNLGALTTRNFGDCLAVFNRPLGDVTVEIRIWNLLSALVSNRQQWIAFVLLTGSSPRNKLKQKDSSTEAAKPDLYSMRSDPFLTVAVKMLANIEALEPRLAIAVLEFVAFAQEHWPWAVADFMQHPRFLPNLLTFMSRIEYASDSMISNCYTAKIASLVADIWAVYVHRDRQAGGDFVGSQKDAIMGSLPWLVENGTHAIGYNSSLHKNLDKNLANIYAGCKLVDFKRTPLRRLEFGQNFVYDIDIAGKLLSFDRAWQSPSNPAQGFEEEFRRANINLSKFEAQMVSISPGWQFNLTVLQQLLQSWKFLVSQLSPSLIADQEFQKMMVRIVVDCLNSNLRSDFAEAIFVSLMQTRAEFALEVLQQLRGKARLIQQRHKCKIISAAVQTVRAAGGSFTGALQACTLDYYRILLRVLFLTLQLIAAGESKEAQDAELKESETEKPSKAPNVLRLVQEILTTVVAQGFRGLTSYLHEEPTKGAPADFAILDALLRSCLIIKDIDRLYAPIVTQFGDGAARSAVTLFSYADKLTVDGDPVFGELSIRFLLQLSTIPIMAEQLAAEGMLSNISSSGLTNYFRRPKGSGPFDQPGRMFSIWANGILPICVNLLHAVGRSMAPEVSSFLNQFQSQLDRATTSFATKYVNPSASLRRTGPAPGSITLSMAAEASSLALISYILDTYRAAGASAGVDAHEIKELSWDGKQVREDIEELLGDREGLRARIVTADEIEVGLLKATPVEAGVGLLNKLEERIVKELREAMMCLRGGVE
jgi:nuclear pore complex protein Nup188